MITFIKYAFNITTIKYNKCYARLQSNCVENSVYKVYQLTGNEINKWRYQDRENWSAITHLQGEVKHLLLYMSDSMSSYLLGETKHPLGAIATLRVQ